MTIAHIAVLSAAILTLLCLACAVAVVVADDRSALRGGRARRGRLGRGPTRRGRTRNVRALRRLDRALRDFDPVPMVVDLEPPPIEQIACDLRRLDRQRQSGPTVESERWLAEVIRSYDNQLGLACRCLGLTEHLGMLDGLDRDIERVRVEGLLQAAGLALRS